jgi:hypothetical protein
LDDGLLQSPKSNVDDCNGDVWRNRTGVRKPGQGQGQGRGINKMSLDFLFCQLQRFDPIYAFLGLTLPGTHIRRYHHGSDGPQEVIISSMMYAGRGLDKLCALSWPSP